MRVRSSEVRILIDSGVGSRESGYPFCSGMVAGKFGACAAVRSCICGNAGQGAALLHSPARTPAAPPSPTVKALRSCPSTASRRLRHSSAKVIIEPHVDGAGAWLTGSLNEFHQCKGTPKSLLAAALALPRPRYKLTCDIYPGDAPGAAACAAHGFRRGSATHKNSNCRTTGHGQHWRRVQCLQAGRAATAAARRQRGDS